MASYIQHALRRWRKASAQIPYVRRTVELAWRASRAWSLAWISLIALQGLLPVASVYLLAAVVDQLAGVIQGGDVQQAITPALWLVAGLAAVTLVSRALGGFLTWVRAAQSELVQDEITASIQKKASTVDVAFYESSEFYDHLHRARDLGSARPLALLQSLGSLAQNAVTLAAMAVVLLPFGVWVPLALLLSTGPALWVVLSASMERHRWRMQVTPIERRVWYYDRVLTGTPSAFELRMFGLADYFQSKYAELRRRLRTESLALSRKQAWRQAGAGATAVAVTGATMAWMVWRAIQGLVTLGELTLFYQAFQRGLGMMQALLENAGEVYGNSLYLRNLFEFLALEPAIVRPEAPRPIRPIERGITFENVTFTYPGTREPVFRDFQLFLPAGKTIALVGSNGAGKSTFTKLLCRFYDPESGRITIDGADLREFDPEELRRQIAALFQEPVRYNETASLNIAVGDVERKPTDGQLERAAQAAGADGIIRRLPHGYEQLLGKWFLQGTELSVGEWQRIALARAAFRDAPVLILDEPTSAMDPWSEVEWGRRLRSWTQGKTTIVITHRFTTAMFADEIHVLEKGQVVESGTHDELLRKNGRYAEAWSR